ncbi:MAG TPA: hypothetical protein VMQ44_02985 [Candidatus Saccharimonadales bacterium]|nr:hypothetical protein [Candidatus Saccharimonadales bacterium]
MPIIREPFVFNLGQPVICYVLGAPEDDLPKSQDKLRQLIQELILPATKEANSGGLLNIGELGYFVAILWLDDGRPAVDLWCFFSTESSANPDVNFTYCNEYGSEPAATVTCGDSLIILGMEELQRRTSISLDKYIKGPRPMLPDLLLATDG